jgi:hypothetical protein
MQTPFAWCCVLAAFIPAAAVQMNDEEVKDIY